MAQEDSGQVPFQELLFLVRDWPFPYEASCCPKKKLGWIPNRHLRICVITKLLNKDVVISVFLRGGGWEEKAGEGDGDQRPAPGASGPQVTYLIVTPRTSTRSFRTSGDLSHCQAADQHQELQDLRWLISLSRRGPAPGAPGPQMTHLIVMPQPSPRSSFFVASSFLIDFIIQFSS